MRNRLSPPEGQGTPPPVPPERRRRVGAGGHARSLVSELLILVICGVFWWQTYEFEQEDAAGLGPTFVPRLLLVLLALCTLIRVAQTVRSSRRRAGVDPEPKASKVVHAEEGEIAEEDYPSSTRHLLLGIALAVGYVLGTIYLGYPLATFLLVVAFVWTARGLNWVTFAVALGIALGFPYLFVRIVFIDLPTGVGVFDSLTVGLYGLLGIY